MVAFPMQPGQQMSPMQAMRTRHVMGMLTYAALCYVIAVLCGVVWCRVVLWYGMLCYIM